MSEPQKTKKKYIAAKDLTLMRELHLGILKYTSGTDLIIENLFLW